MAEISVMEGDLLEADNLSFGWRDPATGRPDFIFIAYRQQVHREVTWGRSLLRSGYWRATIGLFRIPKAPYDATCARCGGKARRRAYASHPTISLCDDCDAVWGSIHRQLMEANPARVAALHRSEAWAAGWHQAAWEEAFARFLWKLLDD